MLGVFEDTLSSLESGAKSDPKIHTLASTLGKYPAVLSLTAPRCPTVLHIVLLPTAARGTPGRYASETAVMKNAQTVQTKIMP